MGGAAPWWAALMGVVGPLLGEGVVGGLAGEGVGALASLECGVPDSGLSKARGKENGWVMLYSGMVEVWQWFWWWLLLQL